MNDAQRSPAALPSPGRITRRLADVAVGDTLAPLAIPLTTTLIVSGAIASRDFQEVHHDPAIARARGSQDIIMNILTTNGLIGRYVTEWAGPDAFIRGIDIRLGAPNYPGDTMTLTGTVAAVDAADGSVRVAVVGVNSLGNHVTGTVTVRLANDEETDGARSPSSPPGSVVS